MATATAVSTVSRATVARIISLRVGCVTGGDDPEQPVLGGQVVDQAEPDAAGDAAGQRPLAELAGDPEDARRPGRARPGSPCAGPSARDRCCVIAGVDHGLGGGRHGHAASTPQCGTDPEPETDTARTMPRPTPTRVNAGAESEGAVEEQAEDRADDDGPDQETAEPDEVASAQGGIGTLISHSPGSLSSGARHPGDGARRPWGCSSEGSSKPTDPGSTTARNYHSERGPPIRGPVP